MRGIRWVVGASVGAALVGGCGDDSSSATGDDILDTFGEFGEVGEGEGELGEGVMEPEIGEGFFPDFGDSFTTGDTGTTGEPPGEFPPPEPFGDDVQETDLVGLWGLNWDPATGWDSVLEIDPSGNFMWIETSANCASETLGSGVLWVEGVQIVFHVETWERVLPWDTLSGTGFEFPPPFRMRLSFSLQGTGGMAYLGLAGPPALTETAPYSGTSRVRVQTEGNFIAGQYHGESALEAIPPGELGPLTILRDDWDAFLTVEADPQVAIGVGEQRRTRTFFYPEPPQADSFFDGGNWQCLQTPCNPAAGTALINGNNVYTFGPYAGFTHLMNFVSGRAFLRGADTDCP